MKTGRKRALKIAGRIAVWLLVLCIAAAAAAAGAGLVWVRRIASQAPDIRVLSFRPQGFATAVYDRDGNLAERLVMEGANREEASYEEIPENLKNAFIAIEDERFWENSGIDLRSILRAAKGVLTGDSSAGGGSTITQQLIKNSVFGGGQEKTFREKLERKIQEQYLAVELTRISDKETILTNYLNTINLGANTLGVKVAARRYFDKELGELTLSECAVLAGITQNPSRLNPLTGAEENAARRRRILDKMEEQGMISAEEKEEALSDPVYDRIKNVDTAARAEATPYSYFTDQVISQVTDALTEKLGYSRELAKKLIYSGGLSIYTTQDPAMQEIVDQEVNNPENYGRTMWSADYRLTVGHPDGSAANYSEKDMQAFFQAETGAYTELYQTQEALRADVDMFREHILGEGGEAEAEKLIMVAQPQVSFVLMDQFTGQVLAVSGGRGEKLASRTLNRATDSLRQPGSVFKVLTAFAPALDGKNATLATVYYDGPYSVGAKSFRNWYGRFYGYCSVREAIMYSMNIVAVRCMMETVSPQLGVWYARNLGISTLSENDYNPSTALGGITDGVSNLELTAAFGAIGAQGVYTEPSFFTKVLDHDGNVLLENQPESYQALRPETAFLLTDAMADSMKGQSKFAVTTISPTGRRAALASMAAAGKSGTTTDSRDLWFVGFTPCYTAGIWSGNDDNQPIEGTTSYHKDIWKKIMDRVHEGLENKEFPVPASVSRSYVCRKSGKLAVWGVCDADPRGNAIYSEYFAEDTSPKVYCDVHVKIPVCLESGQAAAEGCPETEEKVFLVLPEGGGETEDSRYAVPGICPIHGAPLGETWEFSEEEEPESEEDWELWEDWTGAWDWENGWEGGGSGAMESIQDNQNQIRPPWEETSPSRPSGLPPTQNTQETDAPEESRPSQGGGAAAESRPSQGGGAAVESRPSQGDGAAVENRPSQGGGAAVESRPSQGGGGVIESRPSQGGDSAVESGPPQETGSFWDWWLLP